MRRPRPALLAAAASTALAAVLSAPVLSVFADRMWGDLGDSWQNWWNGWWWGQAVWSGRSPFFTDLLWHPWGVSLWHTTLSPLNAALTDLGQRLLPGFSGYNLLVLAHLAGGTFTAYLLSRHLVGRAFRGGRLEGLPPAAAWTAALAGGAVFGFSPYVWGHVATHINLSSVLFVPLFVDALIHTAERPEARWPLLAGLWALCTVLVSPYLFLYEAVLGVGILAGAAVGARREGPRPVSRVALAGLAAAVAVSPVLLASWRAFAEPVSGTHDPVVFSADLLSLFVPGDRQALGRPFLDLVHRFSGNRAENTGYLGYVPLAMTALALVRVRGRWLLTLAVTGAATLVLSLGPRLHVAGRVLEAPRLPYGWLLELAPALKMTAMPVRLGFVTTLALGVGTALGAAALAAVLARRGHPRMGVAATAIVLALVVFEYAPAGQITSRYPAPAWLTALSDATEPFAVADLTGWSHPLYNQTLHGHPILHGYVSRPPQRLVDALLADPVVGPIYGEVLYRRGPRPIRLRPAEARRHLREQWGVRYFVTYEDRTPRVVSRYLGLERAAASDGLVLWRVPPG